MCVFRRITPSDGDTSLTVHTIMSLKQQTTAVIRDSVKNDIWLDDSDQILICQFTDEGYAECSVNFDACVSESQMDDIRESDTWEIESIHPGSDVTVHLKEIADS
jgi:hypothetical protein